MNDIEIMHALLVRLKYEQNLGLGYLPRNIKLTQEIKRQKTEQLNNARAKNAKPTENVKISLESSKAVDNSKSVVNSDLSDVADAAKNLPENKVDVVHSEHEAIIIVKNFNIPKTEKEENIMDLTPEEKELKMKELLAGILSCSNCEELTNTRDKIVPGAGNINSPLMFIGEAPGADENREGIPFIGRAGKKLTEIIEKGMKIPREQVFIANVLKCRPPRNRPPQPDEIAACEHFLRSQIEIINPKIIFTLGAYAARFMLDKPPTFPLAKLRGTLHKYRDTKVLIAATYHPSYLIQYYTKENRQKVFDDTQMVMKYLQDEGIYPWWKIENN